MQQVLDIYEAVYDNVKGFDDIEIIVLVKWHMDFEGPAFWIGESALKFLTQRSKQVARRYFPKWDLDDAAQDGVLYALEDIIPYWEPDKGCLSTIYYNWLNMFYMRRLTKINRRVKKVASIVIQRHADGARAYSGGVVSEQSLADKKWFYDNEVIEYVCNRLEDEAECQVLRLRCQGLEINDIAKAQGCTPANIYRIIRNIKPQLLLMDI